eukprot:TRINITY_DN12207_c0_g1_i1.p2 TRINITY_DN12207_c0_g1~~TRINITY_DN12207_c0_g1_i1.p2  ORF type:complete len:165 (-),score=17.47 TRINITY_DN12207_c0_g1_i1:314-769(-)
MSSVSARVYWSRQQLPNKRQYSLKTRIQPKFRCQTSTDEHEIPPGCSRYQIQLRKPLGLVLEETKEGKIIVAEIVPEGSADQLGTITVGDELIATSGVTYSGSSDYGGAQVRTGQQVVRLNVNGERFETVMAAIGSHPGHIPVELEFQRCE